MRLSYPILLLLFFGACVGQSNKKNLRTEKDDKGRIILEVSEGYSYGEGQFHTTIYFDTLGRKTRVLEVKDNYKTLETFEYSDSSTYENIYYELGHTDSYTDSNFVTTKKNIAYFRHVRFNDKGTEVYMYTKWMQGDIHCEEVIFNSSGKTISFKNISCK